ncbi:MAG: glycosyltransferase family 39 protein [Burkholderiales bacterium]
MTVLPARDWFKLVFSTTLVTKLILAHVLPITGDEAYFLTWGKFPDFGYYDHPPMIGWILRLMLYLGDATWLIRLPVVAVTSAIGLLIFSTLRRGDETKASLVASLYLLSPLNVIGVLITTDTPLILFSFLSVLCLDLALRRDRTLLYGLAGAFLGLALLSKYIAVLLALAYVAYFVGTKKLHSHARGFSLLILCALPSAALNAYWNYGHCWTNLLFNLYNRNVGEQIEARKVVIFAVIQIYLLTPPVLYFLFQQRKRIGERVRAAGDGLYLYAFLVPLMLFALLSVTKVIGLHWALSFYTFLYFIFYAVLSIEALKVCVRFMAFFTAAHLLAVVVALAVPLQAWHTTPYYPSLVLMVKGDELLAQLAAYPP